jgi:hypothetical protein
MFVSASIFFYLRKCSPQIGLDIIVRRASIHNTGHRVKASDSNAIPAAPRTKLVNGCISLPFLLCIMLQIGQSSLKSTHMHHMVAFESSTCILCVCISIENCNASFLHHVQVTANEEQFLPWPLQKQTGWQKRNMHFMPKDITKALL